jgi:dinuclear metal center YbgI/SA1388 family protein
LEQYMNRDRLTEFLASYLKTEEFNDDCPNGLQVEGRSEIKKIATAVSASLELFEKAAENRADAIIVHHGIIWNYERPVYKGGYRERIRILLEKNINLYAFHLPLDAHEMIGNNACLGKLLGVKNLRPFGSYKGQLIGMRGEIESSEKNLVFRKIENLIGTKAVIYDYGPNKIRTIGIISGGAQKDVNQAVSAGLDLYLTGEVSEHIMHYAKEEKIHFVSAGHYATEKFGVKALGELLMDKFNLDVIFINIPNPV